jgi:hypothetical protein
MRSFSLGCNQARSLANDCAITDLFLTYLDTINIGLHRCCSTCYLNSIEIDPAAVPPMTSPEHCLPTSMCAFERWVARAARGARIEYHHGFLILERLPGSKLAARHRRQLARLADAALRAAETGQVHLVQRRRGPFDFAYLAIKAAGPRGAAHEGVPARAQQLQGRSAA